MFGLISGIEGRALFSIADWHRIFCTRRESGVEHSTEYFFGIQTRQCNIMGLAST